MKNEFGQQQDFQAHSGQLEQDSVGFGQRQSQQTSQQMQRQQQRQPPPNFGRDGGGGGDSSNISSKRPYPMAAELSFAQEQSRSSSSSGPTPPKTQRDNMNNPYPQFGGRQHQQSSDAKDNWQKQQSDAKDNWQKQQSSPQFGGGEWNRNAAPGPQIQSDGNTDLLRRSVEFQEQRRQQHGPNAREQFMNPPNPADAEAASSSSSSSAPKPAASGSSTSAAAAAATAAAAAAATDATGAGAPDYKALLTYLQFYQKQMGGGEGGNK
jgi:hypothetical protein